MNTQTKPPKRAVRLLSYFSERFRMPEIQGDLEELFYKRVTQKNRLAKIRFWLDSFRAVSSMWITYRRRNKLTVSSNPFPMLLKNLIVGLRHILKRPAYSFTTITGLSLGIVTCLIIFHYVRFEKSFDRYHTQIDDLAVVYYNVNMTGAENKNSSAPHFVGPNLQREFPEVIIQCRVRPGFNEAVVRYDDKIFEERKYAYADSTFFQLFSLSLIDGAVEDQLKRPATAVLTQQTVKKYFGDDDPIGKTIVINSVEHEITGIMQDMPLNAHIRFDMLLSMSTRNLPIINSPAPKDWNSPNFITYLLLAKNTNTETLTEKVNDLWLPESKAISLEIQSLEKMHLNTAIANYAGLINLTNPRYLTLFTTVAILILLIACINYINLVTARANERGREVGIRKISGATFWQLFAQFMTDSFLHILPAVVISLLLFFGLWPLINGLLGIESEVFSKSDYLFISKNASFILIAITVFAGLYPSLIMTRFKPVSILKGKFQSSKTSVSLRKSLVVFQFCISIALIIGASIVSGQLNYMQNKSLGFDKAHTLILPTDATILKSLDAFKIEMENLNAVTHAVPVSSSPTNIPIGYGAQVREEADYTLVGAFITTPDFIEAMNLKIMTGRNLSISRPDSTVQQFLVNQTFLTKFGFQESEIVGKKITLGIAGEGEIIGVVNDFHTGSLHSKIEPVVILTGREDWYGKILVKLQPGNVQQQLADLETVWKKFAPHRPFAYSFLDESYNSLYKKEMQINHLIHIFSGLAMIIACLGILGLASYNATQRTKEIGIRKVLGATTSGIMMLMAKDFILLIALSFAIAIPLAYYFSNEWLQYFEYRISITALHFILAGAIAFIFAILTIGYQTFKASQANPATALRAE